ncbi:hypothetical protein [Arenicella xantha]|uniref:Uncharacterized protein n=1 Tax=Arenicella xantha TaxID=644221 RepID=A0A395JMM7_9GAMM|nr:hypothetical protein [Arenicella xantha]RBP52799.1 hypothetical protein DFR28_101183 [Arenicella xantha]
MGIVVTLAMLIGLVILRPTPWRAELELSAPHTLQVFGGACVALLGVWNLGYGLRHLGEFWGWAAALSGLVMISAAMLIAALNRLNSSQRSSAILRYRGLITFALAGFFLLYSVTLVLLNFGFPIIR